MHPYEDEDEDDLGQRLQELLGQRVQELSDDLEHTKYKLKLAEAALTGQQRFTKGTWAKDGDVIAVVEARLELRAIPIQNIEDAPETVPSVETQAEVAHLALRHHLGQVGDVIQDMCPYLSVTGGTRVTLEDVVDEPDVAEEEVPQDA